MAKLGDFLKSINYTKKNIIDQDKNCEKEYLPYITNRTLSYFPDSLMFAQEMNIKNHLDSKLQFDYLLNIIRPKKRFSRWIKPEEYENLEVIKEYYGYSNSKAQEALMILTDEHIALLKMRLEKGGISHDRSSRKR